MKSTLQTRVPKNFRSRRWGAERRVPRARKFSGRLEISSFSVKSLPSTRTLKSFFISLSISALLRKCRWFIFNIAQSSSSDLSLGESEYTVSGVDRSLPVISQILPFLKKFGCVV